MTRCFLTRAPFYVARIAEMRPVLIVLAAMITIGILVWNWTLWIAGVVVGAMVLSFLSERRDR